MSEPKPSQPGSNGHARTRLVEAGGDGAALLPNRVREASAEGVSGRRFVIIACLSILVIWGLVWLAFSGWKARYEELAAFGKTEVAPRVERLARLEPTGVAPRAWVAAVEDTKTMLIALTSASVLDRAAMVDLALEIDSRVAKADASNAVAVLAGLWDDLEDRAGPVIASGGTPVNPNSRHAARIPRPARPAILPARPLPLEEGVER
ncbi:MAG: hypothetical protein SFX72_19285 [Isosphaeraceae bacterium]|nr:hypothetical protein [Isosphaeraceae bacterium]